MTIVRALADDMTGALDAGAAFVGMCGPITVSWRNAAVAKVGSLVFNNEARNEGDADVAAMRTQGHLSPIDNADIAFKKIDSLMRGHTVAELRACIAGKRFPSMILAPSFPHQGRITRDAQQFARFGEDSRWQPVGPNLIAAFAQAERTQHLGTGDRASGAGLFVCDAETEDDVRSLRARLADVESPLLWCGSAGIARALTSVPTAPSHWAPKPALIVVGSNHLVSQAQVTGLKRVDSMQSDDEIHRCLDRRLDLATMTGSVPTGRAIMRAATDHLTPVSLELGGKAPFIVMPDADLGLAVQSAVTSRFMNCGQVCICNERTFVHADVYEEFLERFTVSVKELRVGDPQAGATDIGPKVSAEELVKVEKMVADAVGRGVTIVTGGSRPKNPPTEAGFWYSPTIITGATPDMPIMRDEIFGPVVPIVRFNHFEQAIGYSNNGRYGLSAYLFTRDMQRIMRAVRDIDFGELYVNRIGPESLQGFHVGYRQSGLGRDDGSHGLEMYLKKKTVYMNYGNAPATTLMPYQRADR